MTVSATCRLRPRPPARVDRMKISYGEFGALKSDSSSARSSAEVDPCDDEGKQLNLGRGGGEGDKIVCNNRHVGEWVMKDGGDGDSRGEGEWKKRCVCVCEQLGPKAHRHTQTQTHTDTDRERHAQTQRDTHTHTKVASHHPSAGT